MSTATFAQGNARQLASGGFGAVGRFCRGVSSVLGGVLLGSNFGVVSGIAGGFIGAVVFTFAENGIRR